MFDQQNYINNYIKNSYESIKERLRKDNALLIMIFWLILIYFQKLKNLLKKQKKQIYWMIMDFILI